MDIAAESEQIPDYPLDISMVAFADMAMILNALGNEDALAIFIYAKNGISSSKEAIRALGLTQKKFYSRLKDLIDNRLIEKFEGEYKHTALGEIFCNIGLSMENLLLNKDKLKIMNQLSKAKNLSEKQKKDLMQTFSVDLYLQSSNLRILDSFDELVSVTIDMLRSADESIFMASQYIENRAIDVCFKAIEKGVKIKGIIAQVDQISEMMKIVFRVITNPKQLAFLSRFMNSSDFQLRFTKIPYTFLIIDGVKSMIEIKNPITDQFQFAFVIQNESISKKLIEIFESFWNVASELKDKMKI